MRAIRHPVSGHNRNHRSPSASTVSLPSRPPRSTLPVRPRAERRAWCSEFTARLPRIRASRRSDGGAPRGRQRHQAPTVANRLMAIRTPALVVRSPPSWRRPERRRCLLVGAVPKSGRTASHVPMVTSTRFVGLAFPETMRLLQESSTHTLAAIPDQKIPGQQGTSSRLSADIVDKHRALVGRCRKASLDY